MPALYDPAQVERLIGTIDHLSDDLDAHKALITGADKRSKYAKAAALIGLMVGVLGIAVGAAGIGYGRQAQHTADDLKALQDSANADRAANTLSSCIQFNVQRAETRAAMKLALASLAPPVANQTEQQRAALETYSKSVDLGLPYRDCSASGIAAYFKSPPKDPAGQGGGG